MDSILGDISSNYSEFIHLPSVKSSGMNQKMQSLLHFPDFTFTVNVLTGGVWPSLPESEFENMDKTNEIRCPAEMEQIRQAFTVQPEDSERTFKWSFVRGFVTMTVTAGGREVLMQMLPIQGIVLMQFQNDEVWTVKELSERINTNVQLIKQVVSSLVFSRFQVSVLDASLHVVAEEGGWCRKRH